MLKVRREIYVCAPGMNGECVLGFPVYSEKESTTQHSVAPLVKMATFFMFSSAGMEGQGLAMSSSLRSMHCGSRRKPGQSKSWMRERHWQCGAHCVFRVSERERGRGGGAGGCELFCSVTPGGKPRAQQSRGAEWRGSTDRDPGPAATVVIEKRTTERET
jgi:hypothetical protein